MIIATDSPLRKLPIGLDREQTLFFDGIRVCVEIVGLAYSRLVENLSRLAEPECTQSERTIGIVSALTDAWSIVDSTHRLRCLFQRIPHVKKRAATVKLFDRRSKNVEALRNAVQHLDTEIPKIVKLGVPVWGTLQWLVLLDAATFHMRICTIAVGTAFDAEHPVQNPAGKTMRGKVDHVVLTASGIAVDLSDVVAQVAKVVRMVENTLAKQFPELPAYGSDMITILEIRLAREDRQHNQYSAGGGQPKR